MCVSEALLFFFTEILNKMLDRLFAQMPINSTEPIVEDDPAMSGWVKV